MKRKTLLITLISVTLALIVAAVGITFAWYTARVGADSDLVLPANGVLVLQFDEDMKSSETKLKPALARKGAITDNDTDFDVLNGGDNIVEVATVVTYESLLTYVNGETDAPKGQITFACKANAVMADGSEVALSLARDLGVAFTVVVTYADRNEQNSYDSLGWNDSIVVDANCTITLSIRVWLLQPDDLCAPFILEADSVQITVSVAAQTVAE